MHLRNPTEMRLLDSLIGNNGSVFRLAMKWETIYLEHIAIVSIFFFVWSTIAMFACTEHKEINDKDDDAKYEYDHHQFGSSSSFGLGILPPQVESELMYQVDI